eukprot:1344608-Rhodomonas_salina.1
MVPGAWRGGRLPPRPRAPSAPPACARARSLSTAHRACVPQKQYRAPPQYRVPRVYYCAQHQYRSLLRYLDSTQCPYQTPHLLWQGARDWLSPVPEPAVQRLHLDGGQLILSAHVPRPSAKASIKKGHIWGFGECFLFKRGGVWRKRKSARDLELPNMDACTPCRYKREITRHRQRTARHNSTTSRPVTPPR